jgi:hypothetical protein
MILTTYWLIVDVTYVLHQVFSRRQIHRFCVGDKDSSLGYHELIIIVKLREEQLLGHQDVVGHLRSKQDHCYRIQDYLGIYQSQCLHVALC